MTNDILSILFVLAKARINKKGKCTVYCRITYLKIRKEFTTGIFIKPDDWNAKQQLSTDKQVNAKLSLIKNKLNQVFLFLEVNEKVFSVDDIYLKYKGEDTTAQKTILEVFKLHNDRMEALVGKTYSNGTLTKFKQTKNHIKNFINHAYRKRDLELSKLSMKFLSDLDFYLKSELNHKQISINKTIQRLRKIVNVAIAENVLDKDPFLIYKPKKVNHTIIYLNTSELKVMEEHNFKQIRLQQVKDMFVFCCYSGLAYKEMSELSKKNIIQDIDGFWLNLTREKTQKELIVPLLPKAKMILDKYNGEDYILPRISNAKFNSYIKEVADIVGIDKRITHHTARKTFATTVLLSNDVPMEIVSAMLGHSRIDITQKHYAKIDLSKWIKRLNF